MIGTSTMEHSSQVIQLILVDDHAMFREGLASSFEKQTDLKILGQSGSSSEALALLNSKNAAAMLLLGVDLETQSSLEFVHAVKKNGFQGRILVMTSGINGQDAVDLIQAGVAGILSKKNSTEVLCETIRKVASGEAYLEPEYLTSLFHSVDRTRVRGRPKLTERDRAVLRYILKGLTNREIGDQLNISEGAVKASLRLLFEKLGVRTRAQLVKVALEKYPDQI